ncbi:hypothetical protein [Trinickia fusca]|uniref:Uncharacterized protein n=1 Tax=Trinickia fusca TaxID=2419777 RepID=A0A494XCD8_9BURK|nr:hypothetical protein [Trinickia fusca]RKP48168.1 hypothetical protein D7S89_12540 [Trinickia fusca]
MSLSSAHAATFLASSETSEGGDVVEQIASTTVFPKFEGTPPSSAKLALTPVQLASFRVVRELVKIDNDSNGFFVFDAGPNYMIDGAIDGDLLRLNYRGPFPHDTPHADALKITDLGVIGSRPTRNWAYAVPLVHPVPKTGYLLVTAFIVPRVADDPVRKSYDDIVISVSEAQVLDQHIVAGKMLARPFTLKISASAMARWKTAPILVTGDDRGEPITDKLALAEQHSIAFDESDLNKHRERRCFEDWLQSVYSLGAWALERLHGSPSACASGPAHALSAPQIPITPTPEPPPNVDLTVYESTEIGGTDIADFELAMGLTFCGMSPLPSTSPDACTLRDREAIEAIGELSPLTLASLIERIDTYDSGTQPSGSALRLTTGNATLDTWLNESPERARNALDSAAAIARASDTRMQPSEPLNLRKRRDKVIKASCAEYKVHLDSIDEGWECVQKAKAKRGITTPRIAVTPQLQRGGVYALRGSGLEFDRLVRAWRNAGLSLPPGMSSAEFANLTYAIAHDGAMSGDNLGIVYLNDPDDRARTRRFPYGVSHILAPGAGGGDNAGHRGDWLHLRGLSVSSQDVLARVIMAALTDAHAEYRQERSRNGNVVRTYRRFIYRSDDADYVISNVRIVLGHNGMVITAYPLSHAQALQIRPDL